MAYYTALITAWSSATPTAVTHTGTSTTVTTISSGMTTQQKLTTVNGWGINGPAITPNIPVTQVIGSILSTDLLALTALQLQEMQFLLQSGESVYAPIGGTVRNTFASIFAGKTTTLANLSTLVSGYDNGPTLPWVTSSTTLGGAGLGSIVSTNDLDAAGGLS